MLASAAPVVGKLLSEEACQCLSFEFGLVRASVCRRVCVCVRACWTLSFSPLPPPSPFDTDAHSLILSRWSSEPFHPRVRRKHEQVCYSAERVANVNNRVGKTQNCSSVLNERSDKIERTARANERANSQSADPATHAKPSNSLLSNPLPSVPRAPVPFSVIPLRTRTFNLVELRGRPPPSRENDLGSA